MNTNKNRKKEQKISVNISYIYFLWACECQRESRCQLNVTYYCYIVLYPNVTPSLDGMCPLQVPTTALMHLQNLSFLNLNYNMIKVLGQAAFMGLKTLERLSLYNNQLTHIDENAFSGIGKWVKYPVKVVGEGGSVLSCRPHIAFPTLLQCFKGVQQVKHVLSRPCIPDVG